MKAINPFVFSALFGLLGGFWPIGESVAGVRSESEVNHNDTSGRGVARGDANRAIAGSAVQLVRASLMGLDQGQSVQRGSLVGVLEGTNLKLVGYFSGLNAPWIQIDLYDGDPGGAGEVIRNIGLTVPEGGGDSGGIEAELTLTQAEVMVLTNANLYLNVRTLGDRTDDISGQILGLDTEAPELLETGIWHVEKGALSRRGAVLAILEENEVRLAGFAGFEALAWQVSLHRGAPGTDGEFLAIIWNNVIGPGKSNVGFDLVLPLTAELKQDLLDGLLYLEFMTASVNTAYGRLLLSPNQAPAASQITQPAGGSTITIGGAAGGDPTDPESALTEITFTSAEDPEGDPVMYIWQASRSADFGASVSVAVELGPDQTTLPLTVATAAALFDTTWSAFPGTLPPQTPVPFYHRIVTTDGARMTVGATAELTLIRGTITGSESDDELPGAFTLHGNYPNPFNPGTIITFDLPAPSDVRVEVFNLLGQQVLSVPADAYAAGAGHRIQIDGSSLASGNYIYRVYAESANEVRVVNGAMALIK